MMLATKLLGTWRVPPAAVNDAAETDASTAVGGNVLTNDSGGTLYVSAVNGLPGNVGQIVAGSNGGDFVVTADGSWTFDPAGDFAALSGSDAATTSVTYHASNGEAEASATLTVTVSAVAGALWTPAFASGTVVAFHPFDPTTVTESGGAVSAIVDDIGGIITASQGTSSLQPTLTANALGTLSALTFSADKLVIGSDQMRSFFGGAGKLLMIALYYVSETNTSGQRIFQAEGSTTGDTGYVAKLVGASSYAILDGVYDGAWQIAAHVTGGGWHLDVMEYVGGSYLTTYDWGVLTGTDSAVGTVLSTPAAGSLAVIGATGHASASRYYYGKLVALAFVRGDVSERKKWEGYYAHLCGLAANLPTGHPYKSAPPTI